MDTPQAELQASQAALRRREATRAFLRYFAIVFLVVLMLSGFTAYAVVDAMRQSRESRSIRMEYCHELEKLKTENREDVFMAEREYARNLRLLGIRDTPELRKAAEEGWARKLARNAPKACPYTAP